MQYIYACYMNTSCNTEATSEPGRGNESRNQRGRNPTQMRESIPQVCIKNKTKLKHVIKLGTTPTASY